MNPTPYWPTVAQAPEQQAAAIRQAERQDAAVLAILRLYAQAMTPWQIHAAGLAAGRRWLIGSVRRSTTNLANAGALERTDRTRIGPQGAPEHFWALADAGTQAPYRQPVSVTVEAA